MKNMFNFYCLYIFTVVYGWTIVSGGPADGCVLPRYPEHGTYTVHNKPNAVPGQAYDMIIMTLTCDPGYSLDGIAMTSCSNHSWSQPLPQCVRFCKLTPHSSIEYLCKVTGDRHLSGTRECGEYEPSGTIVKPACKRPLFFYNGILRNMRCNDGVWDHVAICQPECGTPTPSSDQLVINGNRSERGELPWHAGIYLKIFDPYMQICGGSLVSTTVIISAAHCFWSEADGLQSYQNYAAAVGKLYRPWNDSKDTGVHKSEVGDIRIPIRFMGSEGNYQDDIALVVMTTPVVYKTYIRPVCVNFDVDFDNRQLQNSKIGKVAGWGLTNEDATRGSPVLRTTELPYVDIRTCIADLPPSFRSHITSDKICAGFMDGNTNLCKGDSGGGLVFPDVSHGIERYYLRGVVSTAPTSSHQCNRFTYTSFTHILKHAEFIKENGLGADGRQSYPLSCETHPEAPHCATTADRSQAPSPRFVPWTPAQAPVNEEFDKQPIAAVRNLVSSLFARRNG